MPRIIAPNGQYVITPENWGRRSFETPHDCRRTMTTFVVDHKLRGAATVALGHKMPHHRSDEREKLAPVTERHYNRSQNIDQGRRDGALGDSPPRCL